LGPTMVVTSQELEAGGQLLQETPSGTAVGNGSRRCSRHTVTLTVATACTVLLGSGAWFASSEQHADAVGVVTSAGTGVAVPHTAMMRSIMQASHFMQSCSSKCNRKLDADLKTCKVGERGCPRDVYHTHGQCCSTCIDGKCHWPCSEACNQDYAKAALKCAPGVMGCQRAAAHVQKQCCSKCPLGKCTPAEPTEADYRMANTTAT